MYSHIVVPLDGSTLSQEALSCVRVMARAFRSRLSLIEVIPPVPPVALVHGDPMLAAAPPLKWWGGVALEEARRTDVTVLQEQARGVATRRLERVAATLRREGFPVVTHVVEDDDPAAGILSIAREEPGSLVAMSTHGRGGIGRWMLGSVTDRVLRHTDLPTLVVRAHGASSDQCRILRKVVLPLDGSSLSEAVIPQAVKIALALEVPVTVVRAMPIWEYRYAVDLDLPEPTRHLGELLNREITEYLARMSERLHGLGVSAVGESAPVMRPDLAILAEAGEAGDALIVMSSHGYGGPRRWVLGSVTDRVVRGSAGPVLVVRPPADGKDGA